MWKWLLAFILIFAAASFLATWGYGKFARRLRGKDSYALSKQGGQTRLDKEIGAATDAHPGQTGLLMIDDNLDAFAVRGMTARLAERSLDLMYYIWHDDLTGRLLMSEVLAAAERGVRVRMLLDDIGTPQKNDVFSAMAHHERIEIRIFNPTAERPGSFHRAIEMALRAFSVTRRMHNKAWIADGRIAILGGRNIGDQYFDACNATHFRDMDVLVLGKAVDETEAMFDAYWTSGVALPAQRLKPLQNPGNILAKLIPAMKAIGQSEGAKPYLEEIALRHALFDPHMNRPDWTDSAQVMYDPPEKAIGRKGENWLMSGLVPVIDSAQHRLEITSPYFIPGDEGVDLLSALSDRGVAVGVLTNSLAATDVAAVHGGYAPYREPLLEAGIRIWEQRRDIKRRLRLRGSSGASLHTKAFLVDGHIGFIGSMNFDPRSASLNTEMGLLFDCHEIAARMEEIWLFDIDPDHSYEVRLNDHKSLEWHSRDEEDQPIVLHDEPQASFWRKMTATVIGQLPLESQL